MKQIEQQIVDRAIDMFDYVEKKPKGKMQSNSHVVEAILTYSTNDLLDRLLSIYQSLPYQSMVINKDYGELLDNGNGTDSHRKSNMPVLDEPWCHLLHELMECPKLCWSVYELKKIEVDVIYSDKTALKINNDGTDKKLKWAGQNRMFQ